MREKQQSEHDINPRSCWEGDAEKREVRVPENRSAQLWKSAGGYTEVGGNFGERVRRCTVLMLSNSNQREGDGKEEKEKLHSLKPPSLMGRRGGLQRKGGHVQNLAKKEFP